ncbi:hypothetical protein LINPERHAP2_LOCUS33242 [Linum perenne]
MFRVSDFRTHHIPPMPNYSSFCIQRIFCIRRWLTTTVLEFAFHVLSSNQTFT